MLRKMISIEQDAVKPQNIMNEDWRYLIIFDACRYDYFQKHYKNYFDGRLEKRKSPAIWTLEWLEKTFTYFYPDVAYVSSVYFCNSYKTCKMLGSSFTAKDHFVKIYDVWKKAIWNEIVIPRTVSKTTIKAVIKHPEWRFIIHYFQPHQPSIKDFWELRNKFTISDVYNLIDNPFLHLISRIFNSLMLVFRTIFMWKIVKKFGLKPLSYEEALWREKGIRGIKDGYEVNLKLIMKKTKELIKHLPPGKIIITADHGDFLGEKNYIGHGPGRPRLPELLNVPWFEVER